YLDMVLLVVGSAALFRLVTTDSPLTQTAVGGTTADPLLLIAPALLFVALGSITLRLFPAMADAAARFFSRRKELTGALATWQVSREPAHYGRITFLLALAIGVGWFATSFQATVKRSQLDQASYAVGADVRLGERDTALKVDRVQPASAYEAQPEVRAASDALRLDGINFSLTGGALTPGTLLGVDPATFASAAYWRDDLGALQLPPVPELPQPGAVLPITPQRIGMWVRVQQQVSQIVDGEQISRYVQAIPFVVSDLDLYARLHDETGAYLLVPLNVVKVEGAEEITDLSRFRLNTTQLMLLEQFQAESDRLNALTDPLSGWVYVEGALPATPQGETRLDLLYWRSTYEGASFVINSVGGSPPFLLNLSEITLIDAAGTAAPFDVLSDDRWETVLDNDLGATLSTSVAEPEGHPAGRSVLWTQSRDRTQMGIALNYPEIDRIPVLLSAPFAAGNNLLPGANLDLFVGGLRVRFALAETTHYYPTLYAERAPFLIADEAALLYVLNRRPGAAVHGNEAWLRLNPTTSATAYVEQARATAAATERPIARVQTLDDALTRLQTDALSLGLIGLLFIAFAVALALSAVSLLTYTALTLQVRRSEFAVLRALGASSSRLITSIALEQAFVFVIALVLGAALGFLLSQQVLPTLAFSTTGGAITPPFIVQVEAPVLLQYGIILLTVLALVLLGSLLLVQRLSLAQALRYGEE
ncbi:MAG: ABC transporter permease, partial [Chloroflexota bacterium]